LTELLRRTSNQHNQIGKAEQHCATPDDAVEKMPYDWRILHYRMTWFDMGVRNFNCTNALAVGDHVTDQLGGPGNLVGQVVNPDAGRAAGRGVLAQRPHRPTPDNHGAPAVVAQARAYRRPATGLDLPARPPRTSDALLARAGYLTLEPARSFEAPMPPTHDRPLYFGLRRFVDSVVDWLHKGYPKGIPSTDLFPALALLSRRLSDDELSEVARELIRRGLADPVDIGVLITQCLDELPSPQDVKRVQDKLAAWSWGPDAGPSHQYPG
jgi:hypothetical protein